jgi:hypothetical protein
MNPEFRRGERYVPSLTWDEWRKQAREIFLGNFGRRAGITDEQHAAECFHEWDEEEFSIHFENGLSPSAAVKHYFDDRNHDDDQNDPL